MPTTSTEEGLLNLIHHTELQPFLEASLRHCVESTGAAAGSLLFGGAPQAELYCCGIFFPLLGIVMGWLALRHHRHVMGWVVMLIGLLELAAGIFAAVS